MRCAILLGKLDDIEADIPEAERVFKNSSHPQAIDKLVSLYQNLSDGYSKRSQFDESIRLVREIISLSKTHPDRIHPIRRADAEHNLGVEHGRMGYSRRAAYYFMRAYVLYSKEKQYDLFQRQISSLRNIAESERSRGLYPDALRRLDRVLDELEYRADTASSIGEWIHTMLVKIGCLLEVSHYEEAHRTARVLLDRMAHMDKSQETAHALVYLARAQANLGQLDAALDSINAAINVYAGVKQEFNVMLANLWRARLNLSHDSAAALHDLETLVNYFEQSGCIIRAAEARLLIAEKLIEQGGQVTLQRAYEQVVRAFEEANACHDATLQHRSMLLHGRIASLQGELERAEQYYHQANEQVDLLQRGLTITLRPYFLADKGEAVRELIRLRLDKGDVPDAFHILQCAKQRVFDEYIAEAEVMRHTEGRDDSVRTGQLLRLREDYHSLTDQLQRIAEDKDVPPGRQRVLERLLHDTAVQMLEITRQRRMEQSQSVSIPQVAATQSQLRQEDALIAYYDDGERIQGFVIDSEMITHRGCTLSCVNGMPQGYKSA